MREKIARLIGKYASFTQTSKEELKQKWNAMNRSEKAREHSKMILELKSGDAAED